ncbi:hypothetical protein PC116_g17953 [Phytophthora cactorum]|nr:hypothetical protein Pcac1_g10453 [Phytophthora cactorum]KAG2897200.1 hypothetical protein PC114_g14777 [Phytophthora cactorum]KAG4050588.1 hypothetical protein PC123_g14183 [Phytophthora cactorum]KAG4233858.1 hypothetical protein PC116_g17953 [Phytophthora cactorum]
MPYMRRPNSAIVVVCVGNPHRTGFVRSATPQETLTDQRQLKVDQAKKLRVDLEERRQEQVRKQKEMQLLQKRRVVDATTIEYLRVQLALVQDRNVILNGKG